MEPSLQQMHLGPTDEAELWRMVHVQAGIKAIGGKVGKGRLDR